MRHRWLFSSFFTALVVIAGLLVVSVNSPTAKAQTLPNAAAVTCSSVSPAGQTTCTLTLVAALSASGTLTATLPAGGTFLSCNVPVGLGTCATSGSVLTFVCTSLCAGGTQITEVVQGTAASVAGQMITATTIGANSGFPFTNGYPFNNAYPYSNSLYGGCGLAVNALCNGLYGYNGNGCIANVSSFYVNTCGVLPYNNQFGTTTGFPSYNAYSGYPYSGNQYSGYPYAGSPYSGNQYSGYPYGGYQYNGYPYFGSSLYPYGGYPSYPYYP